MADGRCYKGNESGSGNPISTLGNFICTRLFGRFSGGALNAIWRKNMMYEEKEIETIPVGPLGLIPLKSCEGLGKKVDAWLAD